MIAQEVTPRAQQWLRNSRSARVLHIFEEVCTLTNERDEVISLVSPAIGSGPFTVVLAGEFTAGLAVDQPVALDSARQRLAVGPLVVDAGEAAVWQPRPDWSRLRNADITKWPPAAGLPAAGLSANINASLKLTVAGIIDNDTPACRAGVEGLAGRGPGLTPMGDDVLVGVLFALWVWYPSHLPRSLQEWMELIVATAVPRTTTLSANFLRAAADGEAVWQWHELVNGRPQAIDRILAIGHTSGADAWAGFQYTGSVLRPALGQTVSEPDGT